jgi:hypothetical protein
MARYPCLLLAFTSGLSLAGCVPSLIASAAVAGIDASRPKPQSNAHLKPAAEAACSARAAQHGAVHIIDVVQHSVDRIVVWGTVDDRTTRRSFECGFTTSIAYFKLREIRPSR